MESNCLCETGCYVFGPRQGESAMEEELNSTCERLRDRFKDLGEQVKYLMEHDDFKNEQAYSGQHGEMKANIMLTYRHLEDARMRVGKILQAAGDGVSILDK